MSRRVKRSPSSPVLAKASPSSRLVADPTATSGHALGAQRRYAADEDELDLLPVIEHSPARQLAPPMQAKQARRSPDKLSSSSALQTPSASPHMRPAKVPTSAVKRAESALVTSRDQPKRRSPATLSRSEDWERCRRAGALMVRTAVYVAETGNGAQQRRSVARQQEDERQHADKTRLHPAAPRRSDSRAEARQPARSRPVASPSRSPSHEVSPEPPSRRSTTISPTKRPTRSTSGLTFKPPAPTALTGERDLRAAQRAQLQEQRLQALAKRRRREELDGEEEWAEEREGRSREDPQTRRQTRRRDDDAAEARDEYREEETASNVPSVRQHSRPSKRIKPDPETLEREETLPPTPDRAGHDLDQADTRLATAPLPPTLGRQITPPTASGFLTSLRMPTLARLIPHFHAEGCITPGDVLVVCDPTDKEFRDNWIDDVAERAGGITQLERKILVRAMDVGYAEWTGKPIA